MSEPTERWQAQEGAAAEPAPPPAPEPTNEGLPLTLVSDRNPIRPHAGAPVVFPGYEILGELGRGGMGVVYRARQRNLNRLVALKVIRGGPLASAEDKARFHIEAEAAARLHHPNIVQVYDVGEHAGFSYMALELIEGRTLRQWQNGEPTEPKLAARLVCAVARGIQHAHEQGIVHRDLKPANILLAPAVHTELATSVSTTTPPPTSLGSDIHTQPSSSAALSATPKVTDFGLAKPLEGGSDLTMTGVACGTPNYMAPEQVRGKANSPAVDVYGLGAVLYELLTGRPPFVGADAAEVMNLILKGDPPAVRKIVPGVPRDLGVIVAKCLEKEPTRRYLTARDLADDLDRFLADNPITARPVGTAERAWRWVKRNPVVTAFLLISTIGCTITGGLAVALAQSEADERNAHAAADAARDDADRQRLAAEAARDGLKEALLAAEAARQLAENEKAVAAAAKEAADIAREAAKQEARRAVEKQKEADAARARAEDNLRVARGVIRVSLRELSRHPRFEDEDFREARVTLIKQARTFRDTVAKQALNTAEWLDDLADVSHWLGFLEYLNDNQTGAATEYKRAAEAAGKWAALEPQKPEPRGRQSFSLVNAGNALVNARRYPDAETCYRDAIKLIDAVVAERPLDSYYRSQAVETHGQLANLLRILNQPVAWEAASRQQLECAKSLARACGAVPDHLRLIGSASLELAKALARTEKWDEAERHFAAAVAIRDELRTAHPGVARFPFEYGGALLAQAGFLQSRGQNDRAGETFLASVKVLEKAQAASPQIKEHSIDLATACTQYADFLLAKRDFTEAEKRYGQAVDLAAAVVRRTPSLLRARDAWAKAAAGCARLYDATNRHRDAAAEWGKLAAEDPDPRLRPRHHVFAMQSLLNAGDWNAVSAAADAHMKKEQPGTMWMDLGRVWCAVAKQIEADGGLTPADKLAGAEKAIGKSITCLEKARAMGELARPEVRKWYDSHPDFAAVRGKFDPDKK